jgi:dTDP-4-amino-4,6-dideoxygalactose transaminase
MMKIPLAVPNLLGREADFLQECITSTFVSTVGPFVDQFESEIAALSGTQKAVVLCTGTTALQMALEGLGIGDGDLVVIPTMTFIATANAVSHSGAKVWIMDVSPETWTLDLDLVRSQILTETDPHPIGRFHRASGKILRALMPVMIMGAVLDFDALVNLAREFGLKVVVDAAAAIGTRAAGDQPIAATGVDAVCYSFNGNKTITTGGGGAIAAADTALMSRIRHLISTGRVGANYDHDVVAYNFRMTNVQAALGLAQLERIERFLTRKAELRDHYAALALRHAHLHPFPQAPYGRNGHWFSGFWYSGADLSLCDDFRAHMNAAGIDLRPFWKPIHLQTPYLSSLATPMPVAEPLWQRLFPLPCSTHITEAELAQVTEAADAFWAVHR